MRTFAQKPKAGHQTISIKSAIPSRSHFGHRHEVSSILHLQRTIGNQAVRRLLDKSTEEDVKGDLSTTGIPSLNYDFSRIPIHASVPKTVQTLQNGSEARNGHAQKASSRIAGKLDAPLAEEGAATVAPSALRHGPLGEVKPAPSAQQRSGSDSVNAEGEREGPIGGNGAPASKSPETSSTTPAPTAPAAPVPAAPGPTAPAAPIIISTPVKAAPSGAASTRTRVGVGEIVDFTSLGGVGGTWTASIGAPRGMSGSAFRWTAPATTSNTTATITLTVGTQSATKSMTVVPPNSISMRNAGSHSSLVGAGGACMLTEVTFGPSDVCLGAIQTLEVPGPATGVSGFFTKFSAATLRHHPNAHYALVDDSNMKHAGPHNGRYDHCAWHSTPGPYSNGEFRWVIPNRYKLDGEPDSSGRHFTNTTQRFTMNAAGTMTITKAGATT